MPLGMLQAAVRVEPPDPNEPTALVRTIGVGLGATLRPERSGTLYLRINDSPAELDDNAGELTVHLQATSDG
jgi:hypothetical protein